MSQTKDILFRTAGGNEGRILLWSLSVPKALTSSGLKTQIRLLWANHKGYNDELVLDHTNNIVNFQNIRTPMHTKPISWPAPVDTNLWFFSSIDKNMFGCNVYVITSSSGYNLALNKNTGALILNPPSELPIYFIITPAKPDPKDPFTQNKYFIYLKDKIPNSSCNVKNKYCKVCGGCPSYKTLIIVLIGIGLFLVVLFLIIFFKKFKHQ